MISVLVIDDSGLMRELLANFLKGKEGIQVLGAASGGMEGIRKAQELKPQVVLMDIIMPGMDGIKATEIIKRSQPSTKILMLTASERDEDLFRAIEAGCSGFVLKDTSAEKLLEAVKMAAEGFAFIDPKMTPKLLLEFSKRGHPIAPSKEKPEKRAAPPRREEVRSVEEPVGEPLIEAELEPAPSGPLADLTRVERDLVKLIVEGRQDSEIAKILSVQEEGVATMVDQILKKLGMDNRVQLAISSIRWGILE